MTIVSSNSQTSPVFFTSGHQPPEGLWSHLQTAANTDHSLVTAQTTGGVPTNSKAAYLDLQKRAAASCFLDVSLQDFVLRSAQKTDSHGADNSAVALMECAVNLHLLEAKGVDAQGLRDAKIALDDLAGKFQARPAWSLVTMDLKHKSRYEAYQKLSGQIDNLLRNNAAGSGEIFESIQLQLAQDYLVDGLRAGVENRWGPLTAQSVRELMQHADLTPAAASTLDGQLKIAKAGGNGQALGEFVRQTLRVLDLHRRGKFEAAAVNDPAAPQKPQIAECLHHCCGHGGGGGQPTITVKGAKAIANLDGMDKRLRAFIEKMFEDSEPGPVVRPALTTVGTNTEQGPPPLDNYFDMDPAVFRGGNLYDTTSVEDLPPPPEYLLQPSESEDLAPLVRNHVPVTEEVVMFSVDSGLETYLRRDDHMHIAGGETPDVRHLKITGYRQQQVAETNWHNEKANQIFFAEHIDRAQQLVFTEDHAQLNDQDLLTGVSLNTHNAHLPAAFNVDLDRASFRNLERLSGMMKLDRTASSDAKALKALLLGGSSSWKEVEKNRTFRALYAQNPTFKSRVDRMLALEKRGAATSDEYPANLPSIDMTAGLNSYTYSSRFVS